MFPTGTAHYPDCIAQAKWEITKLLISGENIEGHPHNILGALILLQR